MYFSQKIFKELTLIKLKGAKNSLLLILLK